MKERARLVLFPLPQGQSFGLKLPLGAEVRGLVVMPDRGPCLVLLEPVSSLGPREQRDFIVMSEGAEFDSEHIPRLIRVGEFAVPPAALGGVPVPVFVFEVRSQVASVVSLGNVEFAARSH